MSQLKIDAFNHILPPRFYDKLQQIAPNNGPLKAFGGLKELWDLDAHLRLVAQYPDYQQVICLSNPPLELVASPEHSPALARFANDELAALCARHPESFPAFVASLPMNDPDAAVREADRAIMDLGARGVQVFTNVNGTPLSDPQFFPLFEAMARHDLPVLIHPMRGPNFADYATEQQSENEIWFTFGWPYETSACVTRLIFSGIFDRLPGLKIITHHMGGMIPYFANKVALGFSQIFEGRPDFNPAAERAGLQKQPIEYFRMLYADTALNGSAGATRCGHDFFGTDHCLFATDAPFDSLGGRALIGGTLEAVDALDISEAERQAIYGGNLRRLMRLAAA